MWRRIFLQSQIDGWKGGISRKWHGWVPYDPEERHQLWSRTMLWATSFNTPRNMITILRSQTSFCLANDLPMACQWHVNFMVEIVSSLVTAVIRRSPTGPSLVNATSDVCRRSKSSHWIPWDQSFSAMNIGRQPSQLGFCHERIMCQFFDTATVQ